MKYYLRLTDSDKYVNGGVYSDQFLNDNADLCVGNEPHWKEIKRDIAIKLDGTKETFEAAKEFFMQLGADIFTVQYMIEGFDYMVYGQLDSVFLEEKQRYYYDYITLPINQLKEPFKTQAFCDACDELEDILLCQSPDTRLYEAAKSLNLSYLDGKILESLTNKDYTKIIELCKTQLNN